MLLNINSKVLEKLLAKVIPAVPQRTPLTIIENFLLEVADGKLIVTATDLHITITAYINVDADQNAKIVVPAKLLFDIVRALEDTTINFEIQDNKRLKLKTDKGVYHIGFESPDGFPKIPEVSSKRTLTIEGAHLKKLIDMTSFAVSKDNIRPAMQGMLLELSPDGLKVVTTDGHRLVKHLSKNFEFEELEQYIIPERANSIIPKIVSDEKVNMYLEKSHLQIDVDNISLIIRLIEQSYPDYNAVIPQTNEHLLMIDRAALNFAVRRMLLFTTSTFHQSKVTLSKDKLEISAEDIDKGSSGKEVIPCEYTGEPMSIGFNTAFLNEVLNHIDSETVVFKFNSPTKAVIVLPKEQKETEDLFMLLMPVRLNS
ncbi:MAG TPA: DNA polymerase III subunit beta [Ignavibacteriaceae bacterium]|mgnify:CR=1 FL=1|nr:DNA polymerase III subunit beta [Ignavibacteriaceae bacterium]HOJ17220.1 DNA polymerase III subunit beta [Ignavibacteriaceae bacterium]HPO54409.1 DNA polymerase III subunit beta [Ignavibacteriaceae bacterium]